MSNDFYTIQQAAEKLGVNERYVRDNLSKGVLKGYKRGKRVYVFHADLLEFIRTGKDMTKK